MDNDSSLSIDDLLREAAWVKRLARSLVRDADAADDLVQETWISALTRPPRDSGNLRGWLATVLRNALRQRHRRETTRDRHEHRSPTPSPPSSPDELAERVELSRRVVRFALELDEPFRSTVLRRHFEGLSSAEIARRDGVPDGTVRWRLKEAHDRLRNRLDREFGGDRRAWCAALLPLARSETAAAGAAALTAGGLLMKATYVAAAVLVVGAAIVLAPDGDGDSRDRGTTPAVVRSPSAPVVVPADREAAPASPSRAAEDSQLPDRARESAPVSDGSASNRATVVARVVDPDGRPLAGALVQLTYAPIYRATTAADGTARLEGDVPEQLRPLLVNAAGFRVSRAGYTTEVVEAKLALGEEVQLGDVVLRPAATVAGRVTDESGSPIVGATVRSCVLVGGEPLRAADLNSEAQASTDRAGRFELAGVPAETVRIEVEAAGFESAHSDALGLGIGDRRDGVAVTLTRNEQFDRAVITGIVLDPQDEPVAGAVVLHEGRKGSITTAGTTLAAEDGTFDLLPLAGTAYRFTARSADSSYGASEEVTAAPGEHVTLRLRPSRTFIVAARGSDGVRLDEFGVLIAAEKRRSWTYHPATDGRATLQVPDEPFYLRVRAPFHGEVERGPLLPGVIGAVGQVEIELPGIPALAGRVTRDGAPVEAAEVRVHEIATGRVEADGFGSRLVPGRAAQGETAEDGSFALTLREAGEFVVRVTAPGSAPSEVGPFRYDPVVGRAPFDVRLGPGGVLEGHVVPPPGRTPTGTIVGISRGDGYGRTIRVGRDGAYRFERLMPGRYHVVRHDRDLTEGDVDSYITGGREEEIPWNCEVFDRRTTRFDLDLSICVVRGQLLPPDAPHDGLRASLFDPGTGAPIGATATPRSDGSFLLVAPTAGAYRLRITDQGGETRTNVPLEVRWGETRWSGKP